MFMLGLDNVLGVSLGQQLTGAALQGRMNATFPPGIFDRSAVDRGHPVGSTR
jgi:hypothetical protein